jgi:hypothetical protein
MSSPNKVLSISGQVKRDQLVQTLKSGKPTDVDLYQDHLLAMLIRPEYKEQAERCLELGLTPAYFQWRSGPTGASARSRNLVAMVALEFLQEQQRSIGDLLEQQVQNYATNTLDLGSDRLQEAADYLLYIRELVPLAPDLLVENLTDAMLRKAINEELNEQNQLAAVGKLTPQRMLAGAERLQVFCKPVEGLPADEPQAPKPLDYSSPALYGLAGEIVKAIAPEREFDLAAVLMQTLVTFGSVVGRKPHWMHGATCHGLNLNLGVEGETGIGKGCGLDFVLLLMDQADPQWAIRKKWGGLSSGEGFLYMVRDRKTRTNKDGDEEIIDEGVTDKRLLIIETEFAEVLEVMQRTGNKLSAMMRQAWDGKPLENHSRAFDCVATNHHISVIAHSTQADLRELMPTRAAHNGWGNRFWWVSCAPSAEGAPFGRLLPKPVQKRLVRRLQEALRHVADLERHRKTQLLFDADATKLWKSVRSTTLARDMCNPITGRALPQVRRVAALYGLLDCEGYTREPHLQAALAAWAHAAGSARLLFGDRAQLRPEEQKLLDALRAAGPQGLTQKQIYSDVFRNNKSAEDVLTLLRGLQRNKPKIRCEQIPTGPKGGRPGVRWVLR